MRRLVEHRAAALRGVEFFRAARAVEKVRVVERVIMRTAPNAPLAISSRVRRIGASNEWLWPTIRCTPRVARRIDHGGAILERERHRLLDQHVLAVLRGENRVARVMLMRRRDIDDLDRRIGAKVFDRFVGPGRKILRKAAARLGARVGRGDQLDARIGETSAASRVNARPRPATPMRSLAHGSPNSTRPRVLT